MLCLTYIHYFYANIIDALLQWLNVPPHIKQNSENIGCISIVRRTLESSPCKGVCHQGWRYDGGVDAEKTGFLRDVE